MSEIRFSLTPEPYTRFSEIAVSDLVEYIRITETTEDELKLLGTILAAAKSFVLTYTGRSAEDADTFPEFTIAVYVLSEDMYDKRTYVVDSDISNKIVDSILGSRSVNLL